MELRICNNRYIFLNNIKYETLNNQTIEIKGKQIQVNLLYQINIYNQEGEFLLEDGFTDVFLFGYENHSVLVIRRIESDNKVHVYIIKTPCVGTTINFDQLLSEL